MSVQKCWWCRRPYEITFQISEIPKPSGRDVAVADALSDMVSNLSKQANRLESMAALRAAAKHYGDAATMQNQAKGIRAAIDTIKRKQK